MSDGLVDVVDAASSHPDPVSGADSAAGGPPEPAAATDAAASDALAFSASRALFLVLHAIGKDRNIGSLLRTAVAFGAEVIVCGANGRGVATHGAKGAERHARVRAFPGRGGLCAAAAWLKARGVRLLGLEITAGALPVTARPFSSATAIMPGNEALGLSEQQKDLCDGFLYVPQYGNGTASLNVAAATAIALHEAATWRGAREAPREAARDKFEVAPPLRRGEVSAEQREALREARARAKGGGGGGGEGGGGGGAEGERCLVGCDEEYKSI
jgi:tRNA(Leu) C34 or U34 (ribose-2'-O)-methylase TrmL